MPSRMLGSGRGFDERPALDDVPHAFALIHERRRGIVGWCERFPPALLAALRLGAVPAAVLALARLRALRGLGLRRLVLGGLALARRVLSRVVLRLRDAGVLRRR